MATLRGPDGCPWDREQTIDSLKPFVLEETYEVLEAIDRHDHADLREELGDFVFEAVFLAQLESEAGHFEIADSLKVVADKLVRRHPHVFGDVTVSDAREVERNWEKLKEEEKRQQGVRQSPVDAIPRDLPALSYAQLMQDRVARVGFEWEDLSGVLDKVEEEIAELRRAVTQGEKTHELGDLLFSLVNLSRWLHLQAEDALRQANRRFQGRYLKMEELAAQRGLDFAALPLAQKESLWQEAKRLEG
jgi:MazG family protein